MKLRRLFIGLVVLGFFCISTFSPVFASSEVAGASSFRSQKSKEKNFNSFDVNLSGKKFGVIINGFNDRPKEEVRKAVENYLSWCGDDFIETLSQRGSKRNIF